MKFGPNWLGQTSVGRRVVRSLIGPRRISLRGITKLALATDVVRSGGLLGNMSRRSPKHGRLFDLEVWQLKAPLRFLCGRPTKVL